MAYIETDCKITVEGKTFEAAGASVTDSHLIAYIGKSGKLTDWHGKAIGTYKILSSWKTPRSNISSTMYSVECFVDGVRYVGRSAGVGMSIRAKRSPVQKPAMRRYE